MTDPILSEELVEIARRYIPYRDDAINALTAVIPLIQAELLRGMMEPSEGMLQAATEAWAENPERGADDEHAAIWQAMLRAYMLEQREDGE